MKVVEYLKPMNGESPFMLGGKRFEYCWGKYPDGRKDIAVYSYNEDMAFDYNDFRNAYNINETEASWMRTRSGANGKIFEQVERIKKIINYNEGNVLSEAMINDPDKVADVFGKVFGFEDNANEKMLKYYVEGSMSGSEIPRRKAIYQFALKIAKDSLFAALNFKSVGDVASYFERKFGGKIMDKGEYAQSKVGGGFYKMTQFDVSEDVESYIVAVAHEYGSHI